MDWKGIRIGTALLAVLGVQIGLVGLAFAWVALVSYGLDPGHPASYYEAYAQRSSPVVGLLASFPICWLIARWVRRRVGAQTAPTLIAAAALLILLDLAVSFSAGSAAQTAMCLASIPLKLLGGWFGGRLGDAPLRASAVGKEPVGS